MRTVHWILLAVLIAAGPRCASDPVVPEFPGHVSAEPPADDDVFAPVHPGFATDRVRRVFHRIDCPLVSAIPVRDQGRCDTPWQALNEGYAPCGKCDPHAGWK